MRRQSARREKNTRYGINFFSKHHILCLQLAASHINFWFSALSGSRMIERFRFFPEHPRAPFPRRKDFFSGRVAHQDTRSEQRASVNDPYWNGER